jgi:hypothetical protein
VSEEADTGDGHRRCTYLRLIRFSRTSAGPVPSAAAGAGRDCAVLAVGSAAGKRAGARAGAGAGGEDGRDRPGRERIGEATTGRGLAAARGRSGDFGGHPSRYKRKPGTLQSSNARAHLLAELVPGKRQTHKNGLPSTWHALRSQEYALTGTLRTGRSGLLGYSSPRSERDLVLARLPQSRTPFG